ncbi:hypothetical protein glysoja_043844 [Glycine soja]|uniref:Uncharacterized protein n=1 Tax=Glycine soja TaxID=3848 RepID=A0A0B2PE29_GLYSO|nr:hypothetical protein glysoja_043844 [Glycine soja]
MLEDGVKRRWQVLMGYFLPEVVIEAFQGQGSCMHRIPIRKAGVKNEEYL